LNFKVWGSVVMSEVRKRIVFHGRVQGVGFRYTAKYLAQSMGLAGWVKNEYNGTVLMEVQGRELLIFKLMEGLNRNMHIEISWIDSEDIPVKEEKGFRVR
jgi:acylphosphatase